MRKRILDNILTIGSCLSIVTSIGIIVQNIIDWKRNLILVFSEIMAIFFISVLIHEIYYRKKFLLDTFEILKNLVLINKLQTLREVIMVVNDRFEQNENKYKIKEACFSYKINKNELENYNIEYTIKLNINKILFFLKQKVKRCSIASFYVILDVPKNMNNNIIHIKLENNQDETNKKGEILEFDVLPYFITDISNSDHIAASYGLYKIDFQIPEKWLQCVVKNHFECTISYNIYDNILKENNNENLKYNFIILPRNYGKHMKQCRVNISIPPSLDVECICQYVSKGQRAKKIMDFRRTDSDGSFVQKNYELLVKTFKPDMDAVYIIKLTGLK